MTMQFKHGRDAAVVGTFRIGHPKPSSGSGRTLDSRRLSSDAERAATLSMKNQARLKDRTSATQSLVPAPALRCVQGYDEGCNMQPAQEAMDQDRTFIRGVPRRRASSVDFDFYRAQAMALRRQAMRDGTALKAASAVALTVVGLAVFLIIVAAVAAAAS